MNARMILSSVALAIGLSALAGCSAPEIRHPAQVRAPGVAAEDFAGRKAINLDHWPKELEGLGVNDELASQDAYAEAVRKFTAFLQAQSPGFVAWQPDADFVEKVIVERSVPGEKEIPLGDGKFQKGKTLTLEFKPLSQVWPFMVRMEQSEVRNMTMNQRRSFAAAAIGVVLCLMGGGLAYSQVHTWAGPSNRRLVQVAAASVAALIAGALILVAR